MKIGTKSILFGTHQFILHPFFVLCAWLILYKKFPKFHELAAIITHDLGYLGLPNMDGTEGEQHPEIMANWFTNNYNCKMIANEILGHSRFYARKNNIPLSKLFKADKLSIVLYPHWLYLLLANLSGEIHEYMKLGKTGKYYNVPKISKTQIQWLIETKAHMPLMGLFGDDYEPVKNINFCFIPKATEIELSQISKLYDFDYKFKCIRCHKMYDQHKDASKCCNPVESK